MSNIILADDHLIVAQGIASILQPEHQILAIAKDGLELVELVKQHQPDLVITDISMPDMTGIAAIAAVKRINKTVKIICLTMHDEQEYAEGAIAAGAKGYVLKHEASESLIEAVNQVLNGGTYISTSITVDPVYYGYYRKVNLPAKSQMTCLFPRALSNFINIQS